MSSRLQSSLPTCTFCLTISTKGDVSDECVKSVTEHIKRTTVHSYVVLEHGENDRLHLHAVLVYKKPRLWGDIQSNVWNRYVRPYHSDCIGAIAVKGGVCPGHRWYDEYLQKEKDVQVVYDNYDRDEVTQYFPSESVQAALQQAKQSKGVACPWLETDVRAWSESDFDNTPKGAHKWFYHRMYILKNMTPCEDNKKLIEKSWIYWRYRNGVTSLTERQEWLHKQHEDGPSYDAPVISRGPLSSVPPSI